MRKLRKPLDKNKLYQLYVIDKLSTPKIAKILNATIYRVWSQLKYYGLGEFIREDGIPKKIIDYKILYREYIVNKKSTHNIAKELNISAMTVLARLKEHNIPIRDTAVWRSKKRPEHSKIMKKRYSISQNVPNYIDGRTIKKHFCSVCGKELANYKAKKCSKCHHDYLKIYFKGRRVNPPKKYYYKNIWMRSSWELAFVKWCDKNKIKWFYESKTFDLGNTTYTPDFYLPEFNLYIEIKGFWRDDAKVKFEEFKSRYCGIRIKLLEKQELRRERII